jgi:hypothetical protein
MNMRPGWLGADRCVASATTSRRITRTITATSAMPAPISGPTVEGATDAEISTNSTNNTNSTPISNRTTIPSNSSTVETSSVRWLESTVPMTVAATKAGVLAQEIGRGDGRDHPPRRRDALLWRVAMDPAEQEPQQTGADQPADRTYPEAQHQVT